MRFIVRKTTQFLYQNVNEFPSQLNVTIALLGKPHANEVIYVCSFLLSIYYRWDNSKYLFGKVIFNFFYEEFKFFMIICSKFCCHSTGTADEHWLSLTQVKIWVLFIMWPANIFFSWFGRRTQKVAHRWSKENFLQNLVQCTKNGKTVSKPKYLLLQLEILHYLIPPAVFNINYNISQSIKDSSLIHFWNSTFLMAYYIKSPCVKLFIYLLNYIKFLFCFWSQWW
jgi:hypothetical protein